LKWPTDTVIGAWPESGGGGTVKTKRKKLVGQSELLNKISTRRRSAVERARFTRKNSRGKISSGTQDGTLY